MSNNTNIYFSIIIPVYNRVNIIDTALHSILGQTFKCNYEIILVDDGSTDGVDKKLDIYAHNYDNIHVFHQPNGGVSSARNLALKHVLGKYVLFLDSDDYFLDNSLDNLYEIIKLHNEEIDLFIFGIENGWIPKNPLLMYRQEIRNTILKEHINISPQTVEFFTQPYIWNKCYSTKLIVDNGIMFDEARKTWEDNTFFVECLDKCNSLLMINKAMYS